VARGGRNGCLDLLVLTHIDANHIGDTLLTSDADLDIVIGGTGSTAPHRLRASWASPGGKMLAALISARSIPPAGRMFDVAANDDDHHHHQVASDDPASPRWEPGRRPRSTRRRPSGRPR
jgi:hypothetical protein